MKNNVVGGLIVIITLLLIAAVIVGVCYSQGIFDSLIPDENPGTDEPGTDTPGGGTDEPGTDTPGTDTPGTDEPGTEEPGTDEPGTEEPGTEEPGTDEPGEEDIIAEDIKVELVDGESNVTIDDLGLYHLTAADTEYTFKITPISSKGEVTNSNISVNVEVIGTVALADTSSGRPTGAIQEVAYSDIVTAICCMDENFYGKSLEELQADSVFGSMFSAFSTLEAAHSFIYQNGGAKKHMENIGHYFPGQLVIETGSVKLRDYCEGYIDKDGGYIGKNYQSQEESCYIKATITDSVSGTKVILRYVFN